jgi:hypothetical protein
VFGGAAAEFVLLPQFGTSTYFLLVLLALVDFLSGVALRARRPRVALATASARSSSKSSARAAIPNEQPPEPRYDPAPAPVPSAEPAPLPAEPNVVHSEVVSPEVQSPGLQPGSHTHSAPDSPPPR